LVIDVFIIAQDGPRGKQVARNVKA